MTIQSENVAHKDLVNSVETTLHSHAGGGVDVKSGKITGLPDGGSTSVTFTTAFSSTPNVVVTLGADNDALDVPRVYGISTTGFSISIKKGHGGASHTWDVEWIATNAGDA